ncbi:MAG: AGE family epimerase/isomerase, partial [Treponema sp.]|nr:AGE family epimerase/isomerase [Treponema sp.]
MGTKYQYNPYPDIRQLLKTHKALIERDDYEQGNRWMEHLEQDLMKFWNKPSVKEMKHGLWRSFFTDDGTPLPGLDEVEKWPKELQEAIAPKPEGGYATEAGGLLAGDNNADKNFVRSHSRQVFAYGIAYHITGKQEYFDLCRAGAYAMLNLVDKNTGSMYTKQALKDGVWIEDTATRTSQDLAYGMTGIAFYYYLTHDKQVLETILKLKNYIFATYYSPGKDIFTWLPQTDISDKQSVELVSHLDQLYAYMLWLTPSLPKNEKEQFKADMKHIAGIMIERFYTEVYGTFWGASNSPDMKVLGTDHTDFGHSVKAMWVIYMVGVWTGEIYYINFARQKIHAILENAFDGDTGAWNRRIMEDG